MEIRKTEFQLSQELFSPPFSQLTCVNVCHKLFIFKIKGLGDFPGGPVVKTPLTLKGCGFSPWSGNEDLAIASWHAEN